MSNKLFVGSPWLIFFIKIKRQGVNKNGITIMKRNIKSEYKKDNLENENQDFANILNEYREGLLLFLKF